MNVLLVFKPLVSGLCGSESGTVKRNNKQNHEKIRTLKNIVKGTTFFVTSSDSDFATVNAASISRPKPLPIWVTSALITS